MKILYAALGGANLAFSLLFFFAGNITRAAVNAIIGTSLLILVWKSK